MSRASWVIAATMSRSTSECDRSSTLGNPVSGSRSVLQLAIGFLLQVVGAKESPGPTPPRLVA